MTSLIDAREVGDTLAAFLTAGDPPAEGRYLTAPPGTPPLYWVLERPPGSKRTGTLGLPEQGLLYRLRLRAVARHTNATQAGRAAGDLLHQLEARLCDRSAPIAGTGWTVSSRTHIADGGVDIEGQLANATADWELWVYPGT